MRIAALAIVAAGLAASGAALAIVPPKPPPSLPIATTGPLPASGTGLIGYAFLGSLRTTCAPTRACFRPAHVTLRFARAGVIVARVATRTTGAYRIALRPGTYSVSATGSMGRLRPALVQVPVDRWKRVNFFLSTGIY